MIQQINVEEVQKLIENKENIIILDVRTTGEFAKNRIKGAINIPVDDVISKVESIIPDKQSKIIVYCLSGSRSEAAVDAMLEMGYQNVFNMTSGLLVWRIKQLPLEN